MQGADRLEANEIRSRVAIHCRRDNIDLITMLDKFAYACALPLVVEP